jgi:hypothetical protein
MVLAVCPLNKYIWQINFNIFILNLSLMELIALCHVLISLILRLLQFIILLSLMIGWQQLMRLPKAKANIQSILINRK